MSYSLPTPTAVAYFTVRVPHDHRTTKNYVEDAERIVQAYLYTGAEIVRTETNTDDFDHPVYEVLVRVETYSVNAMNDLVYRTDYQRNRLFSGMYSSTDPKFLS